MMTAAAKVPANKKSTGKRKPSPSAWKKGQSGNPHGAPKRGQSWTELIKEYGELTPSEAAAKSLELSKQLLSIGDGVTLKQAVILRVFGSLLFEPQPGLLNAFLDRAEGKVQDNLKLSGDADAPIVIRAFNYATAIAPITTGSEPDSEASSEDQSVGDGPQMGEDTDGG